MNDERLSLTKKRSARIAAIQGLYNVTIMGNTLNPEKLTDQLITQWKEPGNQKDDEWENNTPPEKALLLRILEGVKTHHDTLKNSVSDIIKEGWSVERMNPVMMSLLIIASFELAHHSDIKTQVLLSEYSDIATGFLDDPELGFAHSALQQLAESLRAE